MLIQRFAPRLFACLLLVCAGNAAASVDQDDTLQARDTATVPILKALDADDTDKAQDLANALVEQSPDKPTPYIARARVYDAADKPDAAIKDYKRALEISPIDVHAAWELSRLQARLGRFDAAWQTLETPVARRPTSSLLKIAAVDIYIHQGKFKEAEQAITAVILNANKQGQFRFLAEPIAQMHSRMASALNEQGDLAGAIRHTEHAMIRSRQDNHRYGIKLGHLLLKDGQLDRANQTFGSLAVRKEVTNDPALLKQVREGTDAVHAAMAQRAQRAEQAEVQAKPLIATIDAYRRNPGSDEARQAVLNAVEPLYETLFQNPSRDMLLPISDRQPEGLTQPEDIQQALSKAYDIIQRYGTATLYEEGKMDDHRIASDMVLAVYPHTALLVERAVYNLYTQSYMLAYEQAMLAEAVDFAEYYYDRKKNAVSDYHRYQGMRRLAKLAFTGTSIPSRSPVEAQVHAYLLLLTQGQWIEADTMRLELVETLPGPDRSAFRPLLDRAWVLQRDALEAAYDEAFQQALTFDQVEEATRIARYLRQQSVKDPRIAGAVLTHFSLEGEPHEYTSFFNRLMSQDPYHVYALHGAMQRANRDKDTQAKMLYANAVVQFIEAAGSPRAYQSILVTNRMVLGQIEPTLKPDPAAAYWNAARTFEQQAVAQKQPARSYRPVIEAAAMRVVQLSPNNPGIQGLIAKYQLRHENYDNAIRSAEKAIELDPNLTADMTRVIADAYRLLLPSSTLDRAALKANYTKSIEAYNKHIAMNPTAEPSIRVTLADMYEDLDQIDQALAQHQYVSEHATATTQAYAYYKRAELSHQHNKASAHELLALLDRAIKGFEENPPQSFIHRAASIDAIRLRAILTQ